MVGGAYDAKTHFSDLLNRVAKGETITITKHGVPVAKLVPIESEATKPNVKEVIEQLRKFREGHKLDGLSIRELIDEGRRY
jgi:prevent-host-death family protein